MMFDPKKTRWGINAEFSDETSEQYIPLARYRKPTQIIVSTFFKNFLTLFCISRSSFPSLTGILALGLFIHNAIITIMTNNKHQENNVIILIDSFVSNNSVFMGQGRDMSLAYILVTATYMLIGASFYIAFPLPKSCIEDVSITAINIMTTFPTSWLSIFHLSVNLEKLSL